MLRFADNRLLRRKGVSARAVAAAALAELLLLVGVLLLPVGSAAVL